MNTLDPKYQQKSKSISSPEQNYFALFATRYPVVSISDLIYIFKIFSRRLKSLARFTNSTNIQSYVSDKQIRAIKKVSKQQL